MTIIVSISQFRKRIADYIDKAQDGHTVILKDEKKDQEVVKLVGKKKFDPKAFQKALHEATGIFTEENHPEWKTQKDVTKWLEKERLSSDRTF